MAYLVQAHDDSGNTRTTTTLGVVGALDEARSVASEYAQGLAADESVLNVIECMTGHGDFPAYLPESKVVEIAFVHDAQLTDGSGIVSPDDASGLRLAGLRFGELEESQ